MVILMLPFEEEHVKSINETHHNSMVFSEVKYIFHILTASYRRLSENISATIDPAAALEGASWIFHAIPVQFSSNFLSNIKDLILAEVPIVSLSKVAFIPFIPPHRFPIPSQLISRGYPRKPWNS